MLKKLARFFGHGPTEQEEENCALYPYVITWGGQAIAWAYRDDLRLSLALLDMPTRGNA